MGAIQRLGQWAIGSSERLGRASLFLMAILAGVPSTLFRFSLVIQQLYSVGVLSIFLQGPC